MTATPSPYADQAAQLAESAACSEPRETWTPPVFTFDLLAALNATVDIQAVDEASARTALVPAVENLLAARNG